MATFSAVTTPAAPWRSSTSVATMRMAPPLWIWLAPAEMAPIVPPFKWITSAVRPSSGSLCFCGSIFILAWCARGGAHGPALGESILPADPRPVQGPFLHFDTDRVRPRRFCERSLGLFRRQVLHERARSSRPAIRVTTGRPIAGQSQPPVISDQLLIDQAPRHRVA